MKKIILSTILIIGCSSNTEGLNTNPAPDAGTDTLTTPQSFGGFAGTTTVSGTGGSTTQLTTVAKGTGGSTTISGTGGKITIQGTGGAISFGGTTTVDTSTGGNIGTGGSIPSTGGELGTGGSVADTGGQLGTGGSTIPKTCVGVPAGTQVPGYCEGDSGSYITACDGNGKCAKLPPATGGQTGTGGTPGTGGSTTVPSTGGQVGTGGAMVVPGTGGQVGTGGSTVVTTPDAGSEPDTLPAIDTTPATPDTTPDTTPTCARGYGIGCVSGRCYCMPNACLECGDSGQSPCDSETCGYDCKPGVDIAWCLGWCCR